MAATDPYRNTSPLVGTPIAPPPTDASATGLRSVSANPSGVADWQFPVYQPGGGFYYPTFGAAAGAYRPPLSTSAPDGAPPVAAPAEPATPPPPPPPPTAPASTAGQPSQAGEGIGGPGNGDGPRNAPGSTDGEFSLNGWGSTIGAGVGGLGGFLAGGPLGASIGAKIGSAAGGYFDKEDSSSESDKYKDGGDPKSTTVEKGPDETGRSAAVSAAADLNTSSEGGYSGSGKDTYAEGGASKSADAPAGAPDSNGWSGGPETGQTEGYADGGDVRQSALIGPDPPGPDKGYASLDPGEFVVNANAARDPANHALLQKINNSAPPPAGAIGAQSMSGNNEQVDERGRPFRDGSGHQFQAGTDQAEKMWTANQYPPGNDLKQQVRRWPTPPGPMAPRGYAAGGDVSFGQPQATIGAGAMTSPGSAQPPGMQGEQVGDDGEDLYDEDDPSDPTQAGGLMPQTGAGQEAITPDMAVQRLSMLPPPQRQQLAAVFQDPMMQGALLSIFGPPFIQFIQDLSFVGPTAGQQPGQPGEADPAMGGGSDMGQPGDTGGGMGNGSAPAQQAQMPPGVPPPNRPSPLSNIVAGGQ